MRCAAASATKKINIGNATALNVLRAGARRLQKGLGFAGVRIVCTQRVWSWASDMGNRTCARNPRAEESLKVAIRTRTFIKFQRKSQPKPLHMEKHLLVEYNKRNMDLKLELTARGLESALACCGIASSASPSTSRRNSRLS